MLRRHDSKHEVAGANSQNRGPVAHSSRTRHSRCFELLLRAMSLSRNGLGAYLYWRNGKTSGGPEILCAMNREVGGCSRPMSESLFHRVEVGAYD